MWFTKKKVARSKKYFTDEWVGEWKRALEESELYKVKGKEWNASVLLRMDPPSPALKKESYIGFYLDLQYGECHELRYADETDRDIADVILKADESTWLTLIEQKKDPAMMIMKGSLKLEKGSLVMLTNQKQAAKALLQTAPSYEKESLDEEYISETIDKIPVRRKHISFNTTNRGLDFESFPMKLFQKAKQFGVWDPASISFEKDREDWKKLSDDEKTIIIHLSSLFMAGEEAVTLDLLPLIQTISKEGRLEEEIFLTSFLWEEAKHTEFFSRFVKEVFVERPDFEQFHKPFYKKLFYRQLPEDLNRLYTDSSPLAQLKASGTYNMIVEGTLAETGYEAYHKMLKENNLLPGLQDGIIKLKQDESRHIAYGLYLINRLLNDNSDCSAPFEKHLEELLDDATNVIHEIFEPYDVVPFGLEKEWFLNYAIKQFQQRINKLGIY
ncbi:MAG: R2-like ligand-binding oxidase [Balneolaceae bacterium]|nr:MAG: R2-like ligand-binding oxidase [Balneolaceae bacterium]